jgi:hypothetical protein
MYWPGILLYVFAAPTGIAAMVVDRYPVNEWLARACMILLALATLFCVYGATAFIVLTYRGWRLIQDGAGRPTPGLAATLLFVPILRVYWAFVAILWLARRMNDFVHRNQLPAPYVSEPLAWAFCLYRVASIPALLGLVTLATFAAIPAHIPEPYWWLVIVPTILGLSAAAVNAFVRPILFASLNRSAVAIADSWAQRQAPAWSWDDPPATRTFGLKRAATVAATVAAPIGVFAIAMSTCGVLAGPPDHLYLWLAAGGVGAFFLATSMLVAVLCRSRTAPQR